MNLRDNIWFILLVTGTAIGIGFFSLQSGGGYDAYHVFLTRKLKTVPPWAHLFLTPLTWLGWPYSYALLASITWITIAQATRYMGGVWWYAVVSFPCVWEIWSGQIEWMIAIGMVLAIAVFEREIQPGWLGVSWMMLLVKPWIGVGLVLLTFFWAYHELNGQDIIRAIFVVVLVVLATFLYSPNWLQEWLIPFLGRDHEQFALEILKTSTNNKTHPAQLNGALWPWGIVSWLLVPGSRSKKTNLRRTLAATLLSLPYLRFYHALPLLVFVTQKKSAQIIFALGWMMLFLGRVGIQWSKFAWAIPLCVLVLDKLPFINGIAEREVTF